MVWFLFLFLIRIFILFTAQYKLLLVYSILCVSVITMFAESWIVMHKWNSRQHSYLFLFCVSIMVNNIGYIMEIRSKSEEAYYIALKFSYVGRIWIAFALFLFIAEMCRIKIPVVVSTLCTLVHIITYIMVATVENHELYYADKEFVRHNGIMSLHYRSGIWHDINTGCMLLYIVVGTAFLIRLWRQEKIMQMRRKLQMVTLTIITESVFFIIQSFKIIPVTREYDIVTMSHALGALFLFVAIFRYNLLDTGLLARKYVIDELSEGIIAIDDTGKVCYFNKPALKMFPELITFPDNIADGIRFHIERNEPIKLNDRIYSPVQNDIWQNGMRTGTVYALMDDTEHYMHMEELEEQKRIADNANRAKSVFLANMSHEIRTPINAVLGMDEMILRESREKDTISYAKDIRSAGKTLLSLINDILDFTKIEEGKMEIIPTQYEFRSLINDIVNMIQGRAKKKGLAFEVNVDSGIPHLLFGDEIRIRQVILNLLTNAVKYTEQGYVKLEAGFEKKNSDSIILKIRISDSGIGMKEEDMDKLFSPFERLELKRNRTVEGTGLGMSIVRQLLELMDSKLLVQSVYGEGSVFSFELEQEVKDWESAGDIRINTGAPDDTGVYRELFHAPEARILVVDDTEVNLAVIQNLLKKTLIVIDTASSGKDALSLAEKGRYDLIFIDHMMPEMDGMETLKAMKELKNPPSSVYVALTANAVSGARETYLRAGFNDYLSKPVDGIQLEKMIKRYLPSEKIQSPDKVPEKMSSDEELSDAPLEQGLPASLGEDGEEDVPEWLKNVPGLDVEKGLMNCGALESFISVLEIFHRTAEEKADEVEKLCNDGDIENYTIKVHAMKSSARVIGAEELSEMARKLEEAGKQKDIEYISKNTGALLERFREMNGNLDPLDEKKENLPEIPEASLKEAYLTLSEIAGSMDYGLMDGWIKEMKGFALPPEDGKYLQRIEEGMNALDWDNIILIANERIKELKG